MELAALQQGLSEGEPDSKCSAGAFEPADDTNEVPVDVSDRNGKTVPINAGLTPK